LRIACARWDSPGPARGVIQIAHDLGQHIGRYIGLIDVPREADLVVYGNDHRIKAAIDEAVPVHVLTAALYERFSSRGEAEFTDKLLSALRYEFGGHREKSAT